MRRKHRQWLWLALMAFTPVCLVTAAWQRVINGLHPEWMTTCHNLIMSLPNGRWLWAPLIPRLFLAVMVLWGMGVLAWQLWQMGQFAAVIQPTLTHQLPPRLIHLQNATGISSPLLLLPGSAPLAFCFGLLRPRICLSDGLLNSLTDRELKAVLCHEEYHCRRRDPLRKFLVDVLATTFFFLPVVAEWRDFYLAAAEVAADRHAVERAGRFSLAGALHKLLTHPQATATPMNVPGISGLGATQARLAYLLDSTPLSWNFSRRNLLVSSLALMLLCLVW